MLARDGKRAGLAMEFAIFAALNAWIWVVFSSFWTDPKWSHHVLLQNHAKGVLMAMSLLLVMLLWTCPLPLVKHTRNQVCRQERDGGVLVGCALPALTLLSCVSVQMHQQQDVFPALTFLYAWSSVSIGLSALLQHFVVSSETRWIEVSMDVVVLPVLARALGIETRLAQHWFPIVARLMCNFLLECGQHWLPRSFTFGEALVLSQGMTFGLLDLALSTLQKLDSPYSHQAGRMLSQGWSISFPERKPSTLALQVGVTCAFMIVLALYPLLVRFGSNSPHVIAPGLSWTQSVWFLVIVGSVILGVLFPWSFVLLDNTNPLVWLVQFLLEARSRVTLLGFWFALLAAFLPLCAWLMQRFALRIIVARKLFHLLVVLLFVPGFYLDSELLSLSYGVALGLFVVVEAVRALNVPPFGTPIATFMASFLDHREAGRVILTHTYLLLGCALPLWLSHDPQANAVAANAGVIALGVGDAMGAVVGSTYGKHYLIGKKTWEGTLATFGAMAIVSWCLVDLHSGVQTALFLTSILLTSLLESCTSQIDNLVLPLFYFAACNMLVCQHH